MAKNHISLDTKSMLLFLGDISLQLYTVKAEELRLFYATGVPGFVFKANGNLYFTEIPKTANFISTDILGRHMCGSSDATCAHLSALPDEKGGCAKVRNYSKHIESYHWITKGYETFNTKADAFVVLECSNYCEAKRKDFTPKQVAELRIGLANFMWGEEITSLEEVKKRKIKNIKKYGCDYIN